MARIGGNPDFKGKKGRSGRRKKIEEMKLFLVEMKDKITNEALIELSKNSVFSALRDYQTIWTAKEFALPILLKDMGDKLKGDRDFPLIIKTEYEKLNDEELKAEYDKRFNQRRDNQEPAN